MAKNISRKLKMKNISNEEHTILSVSKKSLTANDIIVDYLHLCSNFESHITEFRNAWKVTLEENLLFYKLDVSDHPTIIVSIKIDKNLKVDVFTKHGKVKMKHMKSFLNSQLVLEYWSQLKYILQYFGNEKNCGHISIKYCLSQSLKYLKSCQENNSMEDNVDLNLKLEFLVSQIHALVHNQYTPSIIFHAYSIYLKSSSCYKFLQSLAFLILPTEEDLVIYARNADKSEKETL